MDRILRILLALLVAIGATGAELQPPQASMPMNMECPVLPDGTCPCGMPMPEPGPCVVIPSPVMGPLRTAIAVVEYATAADRVAAEPKPWPATYVLAPWFVDERRVSREPIPADTGPPLLASERSAHLGVFRI
jgi:hypothetical protein